MELDLAALKAKLISDGIDVLRIVYMDVIGVCRSKDLLVSHLDRSAHNGPAFCEGIWVTNTQGGVLDATNIASDGLQDMVGQIDINTITPLPWEPGVAYAIVNALKPDGSINLASPRSVLQMVLKEYEDLGLNPVIGPELEFYIVDRTPDGGYQRSLTQLGQVYTTGAAVDPQGTLLYLLRMLDKMDIGVFAGNHEFSPGQYEINLWHCDALKAADRAFLFKTAVKDIVTRRGQLATFMGKPWSDEGGSGFHVHFSVTDAAGKNLMHDGAGNLSKVGSQLIAGLVTNANALTALTNPTVNAFKRLGPDTLAPYRSNWGYDNRSCMVRIPPERGEGTRLEVRVGDGAANPYLAIAGILAAALAGIKQGLVCPPDAVGMAYENEGAEVLPLTLSQALTDLEQNEHMRSHLSKELVEIFLTMKRDEVSRYESEVGELEVPVVTEWELREYIEAF